MAYTFVRTALIVFANYLTFSPVFGQSTNSNQLDFEAAKRIFATGAYQEALEKFNKLVYSGFEDSTLYKYRGIAKYHLQNYNGAIEDLDRLRFGADPNGEISGILGICKYQIHEWQAAKYFFKQSIAAGCKMSKVHLYLGYLYLEGHEYEEALNELNAAAAAGEKELKLFEARGVAAYYSGKLDLAISDLKKVHKKKNSLQIAEVLGLAYASKNHYTESLPCLIEADSLGSEYNKVYFEMGNGFVLKELHERAIVAYSRAIDYHFSEVAVFINRGNAYLKVGKFELAFKDFDEVVSRNPGEGEGYQVRASASIHREDWAKAITDLSIAKALGSKLDANAWAGLCIAKLNFKNVEGALEDIDSALQLGFTEYMVGGVKHSFYYLKGRCLVTLKQYADAVDALDRALRDGDNSVELHLERARASVGMEDFEKAISDLEEAQKLDPNNGHVYYNSAVIKEEIKQFGAAVLDYNKAIKLEPNDAAAYYGRAYSKSMKGEAGAALADLDKAISLENTDPSYYKLRGNIYYKMKNKDKACFDWRRAVEFGDEKARYSIDKYCNNK